MILIEVILKLWIEFSNHYQFDFINFIITRIFNYLHIYIVNCFIHLLIWASHFCACVAKYIKIVVTVIVENTYFPPTFWEINFWGEPWYFWRTPWLLFSVNQTLKREIQPFCLETWTQWEQLDCGRGQVVALDHRGQGGHG